MGYTCALLGNNHNSKTIQIKDLDATETCKLSRGTGQRLLAGKLADRHGLVKSLNDQNQKSNPAQEVRWLTSF